jgi:transcriptional regulator with XRE-family HTH domain
MKLSTLVKTTRAQLGLNLRDLAENVGVSASFLSRIESGSHVRISDRRLAKLATVLGLPVDEVFLGAGRLPPDVEKYVMKNLDRVRRSMARGRPRRSQQLTAAAA